MHMHMHRSGQLRDVLRPKQGAAGGDDSTGEGEDCAASSLHALHELWNVRDEHAAEVQPAPATLCSPACNPMRPGCNPMHPGCNLSATPCTQAAT